MKGHRDGKPGAQGEEFEVGPPHEHLREPGGPVPGLSLSKALQGMRGLHLPRA